MPVGTSDSPTPVARAAETPPVPLGYSSPAPLARPVRRLWGAMVALATGLVLLGIALYALLSIASILTNPQARTYDNTVRDLMPPLLGVFAAVCTTAALVFLGVGLKWLGSVSRAVE